MFPGLPERMEAELKALAPGSSKVQLPCRRSMRLGRLGCGAHGLGRSQASLAHPQSTLLLPFVWTYARSR